jgi:DNA-binding response OmpR family regulator
MRTHKPTILIIEDHEAVRRLLGILLKENFVVNIKRDGMEGMAWLTAGNIPDLILLDMQMPRLNGLEFLSQLRVSGFFRHIPVLFLSCTDANDYKMVLYELGIEGFMPKPFNPRLLKEKIEHILARTTRARQSV